MSSISRDRTPALLVDLLQVSLQLQGRTFGAPGLTAWT
jgi:hypothetical protein